MNGDSGTEVEKEGREEGGVRAESARGKAAERAVKLSLPAHGSRTAADARKTSRSHRSADTSLLRSR